MKDSLRLLFAATLCLALCSGCASTKQNVLGKDVSSVKIRSIQGMYLETDDTDLVLRSTVSTLQDFGFILTQADRFFGMISGIAFPSGANISIIVRPRGNRTYVRANIQYNLRTVQDPEAYRRLYNALAQSMFLTANLEMDTAEETPDPAAQPPQT